MALGALIVTGIKRFRAAETAVAAAFAVVITVAGGVPAEAAQRAPPKIDSFGPYKVGMPLADAKKADPNAKEGECGELAEGRRCLIVKAAVFEEPAVIYAVLDEKRERVDKVIAKLDPKLSRRRAYRCIRLSEKVFALLVVVYGSKYKQQYDENRRPLPAVAWDGELEGRLIFRANCKSQDEGTPLITVVPRRGEGSSVAADLSPTPTPRKGTENAADLLQGQKPGAKQVARSDAVSSLAESAKKAEQQVRRTSPVAQAPVAQQAEPSDPIILGAGPGGLSIDDQTIAPRPAPGRTEIGIDDPSMLPRAAPRTPVSVAQLPDGSSAASKPLPERVVPTKPAVPAQTPPAVARKTAPAVVPATPKAAPAPVTGPKTEIEGEPKPTPTPPATAPAPQNPVDVARLPSNVPLSRTTSVRSIPPVTGSAVGTELEADQHTYVDADDDEGEQIEPVRTMPVFAQDGPTSSLASAAVQAHRRGPVEKQTPAVTSAAQTPTPVEPRDPAAQVASAAIPKSPKPAKPATGQPKSLIAARDTARPAADPNPRTYSVAKPKAVTAVRQPVRPSATTPVPAPEETAVGLPDLDDEPTGTVVVSADRVSGPAKTSVPAVAVVPKAATAAAPKPLEQRIASGQPRRLTRNAGTLPERARIDTPTPSAGGGKTVPLAPARSARTAPVAPVQQGTPATGRPAAPNPAQAATIQNRPATAPARGQSAPSLAPTSRKTEDGVEDFGYQLDLRTERQKTRWKAPVPPVRPWRILGTSSLTLAAVQVDATVSADTMVLDEPTVVLTDLDATARAVETDNALENIGETIGMVAPKDPKTADGKDDGIQHQTDANRSPSEIDDAAGTSVLDEPNSMADIVEEAETPTENVRLPKPNGRPPGTAALDKPLVSAATEKTGFTPTSAAGGAEIPQSTAANLPDGSVPVPAKRPWDTLSDEMAAAYVAPAPIPAARPDPQPQPVPAQKLAEQPDGSVVDIGSSATSAPSVDSNSFGRRTDILDHL